LDAGTSVGSDRVDRWLREHLVCPRDHGRLEWTDETLACSLGHAYPCVEGIPILLVEEAGPNVGACWTTPEQARVGCRSGAPGPDAGGVPDAVDRYVQERVAATCGGLYRRLIGRLPRYPIPELPLARGSGQVFLDIGCGWGRWCVSAARAGYVPVGIDPSLHAIRAARRVAAQLGVAVRYLVADARHLPFAPETFDVVFSYSVLQHFSKADARRCLGEVARTLTASGAALIQMPNRFGIRSLYHQARRRFREPFGVRYWSPSELERTFRSLIGSASLSVDTYFSLGTGTNAVDLLPAPYRWVVFCSEIFRRMSERVPWMTYVAGST
jgi:2-polyprenyl-3-methyl-5-hydroxy-6-metoxy-1,4-benzoquinol methylase/uncharacterized protein YbaR (Trm112 family)